MNNFCLYPPPVLRCFWKDPLMTPTTPLRASFTATPPPHQPPLPPPKNFDRTLPEKESLVPLIKIWCAVYHSNLAWKSVTDTVTELKVVIEELKSISTYFRKHLGGQNSGTQKKLLMNIICLYEDTQYTFKSTSQGSFLSS